MPDLGPIYLSLKLALATSALLLVIGVPIAYFLSQGKSRFKVLAESLITLLIILPPSVIGFYLLVAFSPDNAFGAFLADLGIRVPFTFTGILIASVVYSFPFMVQPIQKAFENVPQHYWNISYTLGKSKFQTLTKVILPNIKNSILTGVVLTFAHTMGEFGVILMIGGNIPGETKVASLAIYSDLEALDYTAAHIYSLILLSISIGIIFVINILNRKRR
ncbi:MAG: molybdate ABC transporter permease subunit [Flavobacteriales bacterium]|nr:molybdate ABC transporter permease subunit [Flavobacteriales bacterium]